jgi:muconolactone delta-isomerase
LAPVQLLAIEHAAPGATDAAYTAALLRAEAEHLWELQQAGFVRQAFFRADRHEAVLMLEADSPQAAQAVLAGLPLVRAGLIDFELVPLRAYPGFARLFADRDAPDAPSSDQPAPPAGR